MRKRIKLYYVCELFHSILQNTIFFLDLMPDYAYKFDMTLLLVSKLPWHCMGITNNLLQEDSMGNKKDKKKDKKKDDKKKSCKKKSACKCKSKDVKKKKDKKKKK